MQQLHATLPSTMSELDTIVYQLDKMLMVATLYKKACFDNNACIGGDS